MLESMDNKRPFKKPQTTDLSTHIMRKMAEETPFDLKTIRKVIEFQFNGLNSALMKEDHNSIEIEGFGRFLVSESSLKKKIKILTKSIAKWDRAIKNIEDLFSEEGDKEHKYNAKKIANAEDDLEYLLHREKVLNISKLTQPMAGITANSRTKTQKQSRPILPKKQQKALEKRIKKQLTQNKDE